MGECGEVNMNENGRGLMGGGGVGRPGGEEKRWRRSGDDADLVEGGEEVFWEVR
jgi:hypothetical protein